jgi:hypothetical protein
MHLLEKEPPGIEAPNPLPKMFPPRPSKAIPVGILKSLTEDRWIAQPKMNGTYSVIVSDPDMGLSSYRRDLTRHRRWNFTKNSSKAFTKLKGTWVICAELLNDKTTTIKDTNYLHDVLVANGRLLVGLTYPERLEILRAAFPKAKDLEEGAMYLTIDSNTWLAKSFSGPFEPLFREWSKVAECEGIVLKSKHIKLSMTDPSAGQIKCRKPTKNYGF